MNENKGFKIPKTLQKRDNHMRTAYLYQLAILNEVLAINNNNNNNKITTSSSSSIISRMYINHLDQVSKKSVLKLHPNLKRSICKNCYRVNLPGLNIKIRNINKSIKMKPNSNILEYQCKCGAIKRFPYGKDENYELFVEKEGKCVDFQLNK